MKEKGGGCRGSSRTKNCLHSPPPYHPPLTGYSLIRFNLFPGPRPPHYHANLLNFNLNPLSSLLNGKNLNYIVHFRAALLHWNYLIKSLVLERIFPSPSYSSPRIRR